MVADDDVPGVVGGMEIAAVRLVPIVGIGHRDPAPRPVEIGRLAGHLIERQSGAGHVGVIVDHRLGLEFSPAVGVTETVAVVAHVFGDGEEGGAGQGEPLRLFEGQPGPGQGVDHHAVPIGQHLVVAARRDALGPFGEQDGAALGQARLVLGRDVRRRFIPVAPQDRLALPVAQPVDVVDGTKQIGVFAQQCGDLGLGPHVEPPFFAFAVGIEGGGEGAVLGDHLAFQPADGFRHPLLIQIVAGLPPDQGQQVDQLGVVVEHLLEVRRQPDLVGGVAGEAAAEVVVDAAPADAVEGQPDQIAQAGVAGPSGAFEQQLEQARHGELRRALQSAVDPVDVLGDADAAGVPHGPGSGSNRCRRDGRLAVQGLGQGGGLFGHFVAPARSRLRRAGSAPGRMTASRSAGCRGSRCRPQNGRPSGVRNTVSGQPPR